MTPQDIRDRLARVVLERQNETTRIANAVQALTNALASNDTDMLDMLNTKWKGYVDGLQDGEAGA